MLAEVCGVAVRVETLPEGQTRVVVQASNRVRADDLADDRVHRV